MARRKYRWLGYGLLATGSAGILGLTSITQAAFAFADDTAIILGPGGFGDPPPLYVDAVQDLYLDHLGYGGYTLEPLDTPEGGVLPVNLLDSTTEVITAVQDLNTAILAGTANGGDVTVFAYSESATVAMYEESLLSVTGDVNPDQLSFVLVGDPSNPNGGLYERLIPSVAENFPYHTDVYTQEYDGFADFPQYPSDGLADANAIAGMLYDHLTYADLTPQQIDDAIPLATTGGDTDYYIIPTDYLPLLEPLRLMGEPGNQLADLLQPDASILVNLGYGNLSETEGYSLGPANVATPFGLAPDVNTTELIIDLEAGWQQGLENAADDTPASQLGTSSLDTLEDAAYTFGLTNTPDPSLEVFLLAAGEWIVGSELGVPGATALSDVSTNLQDSFTNIQDGFTNFEAALTDLGAVFSAF